MFKVFIVAKEVSQKRQAICDACPHHKPLLKVCSLCGCFSRAKTLMPEARCPDNPPRWVEDHTDAVEYNDPAEHNAHFVEEKRKRIDAVGNKEEQ